MNALEYNAKAKVIEGHAPHRSKEHFKNHVTIQEAPIIIASTEDIGTNRVRANHIDASIDFCKEQEYLKKNGIPL